MNEIPATTRTVDAGLLALLACPVCRGDLALAADGDLGCRGCGRAWPVDGGVPDLRYAPEAN